MIPVVFEDEVILVLNKPPGLVVDNSDSNSQDTLENILKGELGITVTRSGIVHRLDKDTSGLLVVAKNEAALENLQHQFKQRSVQKEYLALVHGLVEKAGRVAGAVGRNPGDRQKFTILDEDSPRSAGGAGKEAVTEYTPVGNFKFSISNFQSIFNTLKKAEFKKLADSGYNSFSLLNCQPLTGRTHQIRVHLKYISHPIVGDERYAGRKTARLDKLWCPRQFLHAKHLEFNHPQSGQRLEFSAPLPDDLERVLGLLKQDDK